ncbi:unnamed protein product, partial [Discosporangium mesarthrocarpum]
QVVTATINLEDVRAFRASRSSLMEQASDAKSLPKVVAPCGFSLTTPGADYLSMPPTLPRP